MEMSIGLAGKEGSGGGGKAPVEQLMSGFFVSYLNCVIEIAVEVVSCSGLVSRKIRVRAHGLPNAGLFGFHCRRNRWR